MKLQINNNYEIDGVISWQTNTQLRKVQIPNQPGNYDNKIINSLRISCKGNIDVIDIRKHTSEEISSLVIINDDNTLEEIKGFTILESASKNTISGMNDSSVTLIFVPSYDDII